jgi:hypothetical protein
MAASCWSLAAYDPSGKPRHGIPDKDWLPTGMFRSASLGSALSGVTPSPVHRFPLPKDANSSGQRGFLS